MKHLLIWLALLSLPSLCIADADLATTKCTPARQILQKIDATFVPNGAAQYLQVDRRQTGRDCTYEAWIWSWDNISRQFSQPTTVWSWTGPGLVFRAGIWTPQERATVGQFERVHLLPVKQDQVLIKFRSGKAYNGALVQAYTSQFGNEATIVHIGTVGPLDVTADGPVLTVRAPGACPHSGCASELKLSFDLDARQMAVLNPTPASAALYVQLMKNDDNRSSLGSTE